MTKTYKTYKADLWGNNTDGYDVNNWYFTGRIDIAETNTGTDKELMQQLVKLDYFTSKALDATYSIDYQENEFYIEFHGDTWQETYKFTEME